MGGEPSDKGAISPERPEVGAAGYYLWPLAWIASPPDGVRPGAEPGTGPPAVDLRQLAEVVAETSLPQDLRAHVSRDGLFAFDFSRWAPYLAEHLALGTGFDSLANRVLRRTALMNAHLACLYTALVRVQHHHVDPMCVTPGSMFPMRSLEAGAQGIPNPLLGYLVSARYESTYPTGYLVAGDVRIALRTLIETPTVEESFRLLTEILNHPSSDRALELAGLLVRSAAALFDHDYNLGLITAWAVIESLLQELWEGYIEDNRHREIEDAQVSFINAGRKERLTGRDITASLKAEMLSLLDRLPFELYGKLSSVRVARNKWIHDLEPVPASTSEMAMQVAEEMLRLVKGLDLEMPKARRIRVL